MVNLRPLGHGLMGLGTTALLLGIVNLGTNVTQVDHDYGWGLIAFGVIAMFAGLILYFLLSELDDRGSKMAARADHGSVAIAGNRNTVLNIPNLDIAQDMLENAKPNVVFDGFAPVPDQAITGPNIGYPTKAEFVRLLFVNEPAIRRPAANVPDLHARIEVTDVSGNDTILNVRDARWAENADRGTGLGRDTKSVDMPCNGETRTLDIVMRPYGYTDCFGWDNNGCMIPEPPIPTGTYQIRVELDASNMERRLFRFILDNPLGADAKGVIEDSWIELREVDGLENPCSASWTVQRDKDVVAAEKARVRKAIAAIDPLVDEAQRILESCGRPREQMRGADPMYFQNVCIPRINKFALDATTTIRGVAPEYTGKFQNVGNVTHNTDTKPAMIQQVERWLENLGAIQDELRKRL